MTQLTPQSLEEKTLPELYKLIGENEARYVINEVKIEAYKKYLKGKLVRDADVGELAKLCERNERLFYNRFKIRQAITKKECVEEDV